jgi:hypothetical protein
MDPALKAIVRPEPLLRDLHRRWAPDASRVMFFIT